MFKKNLNEKNGEDDEVESKTRSKELTIYCMSIMQRRKQKAKSKKQKKEAKIKNLRLMVGSKNTF